MGMESIRSNLALMSILRDLHVGRSGHVEIEQIRARWGCYALRRRDLDVCLARMQATGMVELDHSRGMHGLVLTEFGHRRIHSLRALIKSVLIWPRRIVRWLRQHLAPRYNPYAQHRRRIDLASNERIARR